ncbi:NAD(P)/FAD-dependent oxidoreductase [Amycolatopsis acidiphila]|uniref:NAD(P)/FAD-dependent oxidoreductase n=1 Tax=Amycolatopsis acidiphila TaxID=715473 RepID=A0A558A9G2_9PSEU|nr:NAD(P)/FAD-dependent oxidoreductase [Amycolatopsis acidiphila]TVT20893.1 NAD(P)/FAD-dependent oxidoreductase [Amycolatopsis acidiphila]UIJ63012.1 NAD(P)/FAD-dependent oxidoreductase [Amycolatopsis acidiphila]GHG65638.1 flavin-binding monooxygenase [Amycolatopsis acidiphila]
MTREHVDVLIVGAGLSGIGAACHLRDEAPGKTFTILESRAAIGGTWDLFRYPGIRSDSDMFTLGYDFRPWTDAKAIADGESIRAYIRETAREYAIEDEIRFHHKVVRAEWSSEDAQWTVHARRSDTGETVEITCGFLFTNAGYYNYEEGYTPEFEGVAAFRGTVIHPQHWPEDLDHTGKRIVVIGSGATAVTLVPALAERAGHVTMLQRSPSYVISLPGTDALADKLHKLLPTKLANSIVRWQHVLMSSLMFQLSRSRPALVKKLLRKGVQRQLPPGYDVDRHFSPEYDPWDQRLCVVPDGDLFTAVRKGKASIVTDRIATFTERGIRLESGEELEADIVVTATGLNLLPVGGITIDIDGQQADLSKTVSYKGMMLSGVPNFAMTIGYTNASWTLKADLVARYVIRVLQHMDARGYEVCTPTAPPGPLPSVPFIDLKSGYVLRSIDKLPKQGDAAPWRLYQNYPRDVLLLRRGPLEDEGIVFSHAAAVKAEV